MPDLLPDSCRKNVLGRFCRTLRVFLLQAVLPEKTCLGVLLGFGFFAFFVDQIIHLMMTIVRVIKIIMLGSLKGVYHT